MMATTPWAIASANLAVLVREHGVRGVESPEPAMRIDILGGMYDALDHKGPRFGRTTSTSIQARIESGALAGLVYHAPTNTVRLKEVDSYWTRLSKELTFLIHEKGPIVATGAVAATYQQLFKKKFDLRGLKLRSCILSGKLCGILHNPATRSVELAAALAIPSPLHPGFAAVGVPATIQTARGTGAAAVSPPGIGKAVAAAPPSAQKTPTTFSLLAEELTTLIRQKGPLTVASAYQSMLRKSVVNLYGLKLGDCIKRGQLQGIVYNSKTKHIELTAGHVISPPPKVDSATASVQDAPSITVQPGVEEVDVTALQSAPPPEEAKTPEVSRITGLLISDRAGYRRALDRIAAGIGERNAFKTLRDAACEKGVVGVRFEGRNLGDEAGELSRIQVSGGWAESMVLMFDVPTLYKTKTGQDLLRNEVCQVLSDPKVLKVMHDVTKNVVALCHKFGVSTRVSPVVDLQLANEALGGGIFGNFDDIIRRFQARGNRNSHIDPANCDTADQETASNSVKLLQYAAQQTLSLVQASGNIKEKLTKLEWQNVLAASQLRTDFAAKHLMAHERRVAFRSVGSSWGGGVGRVLISYELKQAQDDSGPDEKQGGGIPPVGTLGDSSTTAARTGRSVLETHNGHNIPVSHEGQRTSFSTISSGKPDDVNSPSEVLKIVPHKFLNEQLSDEQTENLRDLNELVLDEGTRPKAQLQGGCRVYLCSDENVVVTKTDISRIVGPLARSGSIGADNRAGFPGKLHRLSVMREKKGPIYGVTLRIGRYFKGSADKIDDLLFHANCPGKPKRAPSILVLGEAGSGKTTVIRDMCRKISVSQTVAIVDTSNEIAGDGTIPHRDAIGESRRLMVPKRSDQHRVMIEALQNHTPQTIVVDEISNKLEARACMDIKARGVRLVASAHGDLQSLLSNPTLNTLVGGKESVVLSDATAFATNGGKKVRTQRAGKPIFDMIIEVHREEVNTWTIIRNVRRAVDDILNGKPYDVERRSRLVGHDSPNVKDSDPDDITFLMQLDKDVESHELYY